MIDWVDCTTVMIGRPSPKTFPSILKYMCVPRDVGAARKRMAGLRTRARYPKELLVKCRLTGPAWAEKNRATLSG